MINHEIRVELGERSYSVHVGAGLLSSVTTMLAGRGLSKDVCIITDRNVARHYLGPLRRQFKEHGFVVEDILLPPGETQKSLTTANRIFTQLLRAGMGRSVTVVALGGGVIGDLAGFVAATYQRGVKLVQIPTTLLAQVDSAVGGKTAVNHALGKNMIGAFHQPDMVVADIDTLKTLPVREFFCGLGEVVKYGIILDEALFSYVENHLDEVFALKNETLVHVSSRCLSIKAGLVSRDERESGERIVLNCGHTIGHALETAGKYRLLKHGEAVLMGLVAESFIAKELGMLSETEYRRIVALVSRIPIKVRTSSLKESTILAAMSRDKKSVRTKKRFVLPVRVGETRAVDNVDDPLIRESLKQVLS